MRSNETSFLRANTDFCPVDPSEMKYEFHRAGIQRAKSAMASRYLARFVPIEHFLSAWATLVRQICPSRSLGLRLLEL